MLVNQYPEVYRHGLPLTPQNKRYVVAMITTFFLLENVDTHISSKVSGLVQRLPFHDLSHAALDTPAIPVLENLSCTAAQRCIRSLMHDTSPGWATFALKFLSLILPKSRLQSDLNMACLPGRPFAYATTGDHGLSGLARSTSKAMQEYRERYAKGQYPEWE